MREDLPRIQSLDDFPAAQGPEILDDESIWPNGVRFRRSHFWRRILAGHIECGETAEITLTRKIGITESVLNEVSSGLEIPVGTLKATLGAKVSASSATTDESTTQYKKNLASQECQAIRYAEWQLVDRITLAASRRRWFGLVKPLRIHHVLDNPLNEFASDRFIYPSPHCCKDDFNKNLADGYDRLQSVTFPNVKILAMTRFAGDGTLSFAGLSGRWRPGQSIPAELFGACFAASGEPVPQENGILDEKDFGLARQLLNLSRDLASHISAADACPGFSEMLAQVERAPAEGFGTAADHITSGQCRRCDAAFAFLRVLNRNSREEWARSYPVVLALPLPLVGDDDPTEDRENRRQLSLAGLRVRLMEHRGKVVLDVITWNTALADKEVEVLVLGQRPRRSRFPLKSEAGGVLTGEVILKVAASEWSASGKRRILLIRFVEPSAARQLLQSIGSVFHRQGQTEVPKERAVPAVAVTETEVHSVGPLVGGVIRSVDGPVLTIEAAVEGGLHIGQTLHIFSSGVFLGVAVVSRRVPGGATCEFQPAAETAPVPGDMAMVPGTD